MISAEEHVSLPVWKITGNRYNSIPNEIKFNEGKGRYEIKIKEK